MSEHEGLLGSLNRHRASDFLFKPPPPGAGNGFTITAPGQYAYEVLAGSLTVTNSATTAINSPTVRWFDGDGQAILSLIPVQTIAAGQNQSFNFAPDCTTQAGSYQLEIPKLIIWPGWSFAVLPVFEGANGAFTNINILVRRYPLGDGGREMTGGPGIPEERL